MPGSPSGAGLRIRRATLDDLPAILALGRRSLGWPGDETDAALLRWKHGDNPFGSSPMWIGEIGGRVAGFRTFLRWELVAPDGLVRRAARAVDTATDPDYQGRGVFRALTRHALEELQAEGIDFVFNTPNDRSRPGYLTMGWRVAGRLPAAVRMTRPGSFRALGRARQPATRGALASTVGTPAVDVLSDRDAVGRLLAAVPRPAGLATRRSPEYLAWRYRLEGLHYRAYTAGGDRGDVADGLVVFHLRRRGAACEAVVCELLVPSEHGAAARALCRRIARESGADYVLRLAAPRATPVGAGGFVRVPRAGPILTVRALRATPPASARAWDLTMGDIEVF